MKFAEVLIIPYFNMNTSSINSATSGIKKQTVFLNLSIVLFCLLLFQGLSAQNETFEAKGILTFESETIDYGTIDQNADGVRTFTFINTGNAPIVIAKVKTTCGCTAPSFNKNAILPGETSNISIKYATNRIGAFSKSVTVISNASEANKILKIKGKVLKSNTDS